MILVKRLQRYQRSKLEVEKNICQLGWARAHGFELGRSADISFDIQLWPLISLQPLDQNQCLVLHLKDIFHICLEIKVQGFWMTFKVFNLGSKWPHLHRAYVLRVFTNISTTVSSTGRAKHYILLTSFKFTSHQGKRVVLKEHVCIFCP